MCETARETIVETPTTECTTTVENVSETREHYMPRVCVCMDVVREWGSVTPANTKTARGRRVSNTTHAYLHFFSLLLGVSSSIVSKRLVILHGLGPWLYYERLDNDRGEVAVDG